MTLWTWEAAGACGVGREAAEARLLRQLPGARVVLREVRLVTWADLEGTYEPTGRVLAGALGDDGTVTWS